MAGLLKYCQFSGEDGNCTSKCTEPPPELPRLFTCFQECFNLTAELSNCSCIATPYTPSDLYFLLLLLLPCPVIAYVIFKWYKKEKSDCVCNSATLTVQPNQPSTKPKDSYGMFFLRLHKSKSVKDPALQEIPTDETSLKRTRNRDTTSQSGINCSVTTEEETNNPKDGTGQQISPKAVDKLLPKAASKSRKEGDDEGVNNFYADDNEYKLS